MFLGNTSFEAKSYTQDPIGFCDDLVPLNEKGKPWRLSWHQRRVLSLAFRWVEGRLALALFVWGEVKKAGKTFVAAVPVGLWWAFTRPNTEVILAANDKEQSTSRVFDTMVKVLRANPGLLASVVSITKDTITLTNGTTIRAVAADYKGEAGARHSLVIHDELWGATSEAAVRLYEELTPPPTEPEAFRMISTYAGFVGESELLERIYLEGLTGERLDEELELFGSADRSFVMFWSGTARQPWQVGEAGRRYYAQQKRDLRPNAYARLHENKWVTGESPFVTPERWDACRRDDLTPLLKTNGTPVFIGLDASTKHDRAAGVVVMPDGPRLRLVDYRIWRPTPDDPLDIELTLEAWLLQMAGRHTVARVYADPFQLHRTIMSLARGGLPIEEFPQSEANLTRMGQNLFELIKGRNLLVFDAPDLRQHALDAVALEKSRGWRIAKEKTTKKIDGCVALAMGCMAAVDHGFRGVGVGTTHLPWL